MAKQKAAIKLAHIAKAHRRRGGWFAVLLLGILIIQFTYNLHVGHPQVLGYSAKVTGGDLLEETNGYRKAQHLADLQTNDALTRAAQAKAQDMARKNYWNHKSPDGRLPEQFIHDAGYEFSVAGENLAYGFATGSEVVSGWMSSQEHRENILGHYQDVGFGIVESANYQGGNNTIVVALYGTPKDPAILPVTMTKQVEQTTFVNGLNIISTGNATWANYASLALIGAAAVGFIVTHLELFKQGWYRSKKLLLIHPMIDGLFVLAVASLLLYAASGFIK